MENKKRHRERGAGTIYRLKTGRWRVQISLPEGQRRSACFGSRDECKDWLVRIQYAQQCGRPGSVEVETLSFPKEPFEEEPVESEPVEEESLESETVEEQPDVEESDLADQTLAEYLPTWFMAHQSLLKPTTRADYQRILDKYILPGLGEKRLSDLRRSVFDQYYTRLVQQGMGKTYVYYVHRVLRKALGDAVDDRLILYNPTLKAKLPRLERCRRRRSPLTVEETNRLVQTAMQTQLGPLIYVAIKTGMREGELFALRWEDIDWQQRQVHVRRNVQRIRENGKAVVLFTTPKSEAGNRIINVGPATLKVLQQQLEAVALLRALSRETWQEHNLVFPSTVGTPRNPSNFRKHYNQLLAAAGVPKITFHDLRHMAASIMLNNGVSVLVASHILGHAQPSTTMNMYGHEFTDQEIKAAEMMDQVVPQPEQPILVGELVKVRDLHRTH